MTITKYALHIVSMIGTFMVLYGGLYLILKGLIGWIPLIKNTTIYGVPLELPLFSATIMTFIFTCIKISSPYVD